MSHRSSSTRRRFLERTGAALAIGAGVSVGSQSAAAAVTDRRYQIEVTPLDSGTAFDLEFGSGVDPVVAQEPYDGYCYTSGSTVYGSIDDDWSTAIVGVNAYDPRSIEADDGPLAFGAEFLEENTSPSVGLPPDDPYDPDRFCQIEVSGNGKYVVGIPYVSGVATTTATAYGDAWGVASTVEFGPSQFVGMDAGRSSVSFQFASQDNIVAIEHNGENEPVYNRFGPSSVDIDNRTDPHDGVGLLGAVEGGVDRYQTAGFEKDPGSLFSSVDLYGPVFQEPSWMRLGAGVDVEISTTDTNRGCPWV